MIREIRVSQIIPPQQELQSFLVGNWDSDKHELILTIDKDVLKIGELRRAVDNIPSVKRRIRKDNLLVIAVDTIHGVTEGKDVRENQVAMFLPSSRSGISVSSKEGREALILYPNEVKKIEFASKGRSKKTWWEWRLLECLSWLKLGKNLMIEVKGCIAGIRRGD
jgi:hypothetical protein